MTNAFAIRPALANEREALESVQRRASLSNAGDRKSLLANPEAIALPLEQIALGRVFVAERDSDILGFAAILPRTDGGTELDGLFVEPAIWRHGVGRSLVAYCGTVARLQGADFMHVVGNPHAAGFYTACGFENTGTQMTRFGAGLLMRLRL